MFVLCEYIKRLTKKVFSSNRSNNFSSLNEGFVDSLNFENVTSLTIVFSTLCRFFNNNITVCYIL